MPKYKFQNIHKLHRNDTGNSRRKLSEESFVKVGSYFFPGLDKWKRIEKALLTKKTESKCI
jgi:hypothetical protein